MMNNARLPHSTTADASTEAALDKKVKVVLPFRGVMTIPVHMPHMGNPFLLEISVHPLADADQAILVTAPDPEQF
jgi:hypothetical protein